MHRQKLIRKKRCRAYWGETGEGGAGSRGQRFNSSALQRVIFPMMQWTANFILVFSRLRLPSQCPLRYHPQKFAPSSLLRISRHSVEKGLLTLIPTEGRSALSMVSSLRCALQPPKRGNFLSVVTLETSSLPSTPLVAETNWITGKVPR